MTRAACPVCVSGNCSLHVERECEVCPQPILWNDSQVSTWGKNFWHTACFNAERERGRVPAKMRRDVPSSLAGVDRPAPAFSEVVNV